MKQYRIIRFLAMSVALLWASGVSAESAASVPRVDDGAWIFGYWRTDARALHLAWSRDALHWHPLNGDQPILHATVGKKTLRDFFIARDAEGTFRLVAPDLLGGTNATNAIITFRSDDLIHWHGERLVPLMEGIPGARCVWGPEFFYDDAKKDYLVWWACPHTDPKLDRRTWAARTTDFRTFTQPELFFDPGYMVIDATMQHWEGRYLFIFKDNRREPLPESERHVVRIATASTIDGPFGDISGILSPNWTDGPSALQVGERRWLLFYECYKESRYGVSVSTDLQTWTPLAPDRYKFPQGARHGTFFRVTEKELQTLRAHFDTP